MKDPGHHIDCPAFYRLSAGCGCRELDEAAEVEAAEEREDARREILP